MFFCRKINLQTLYHYRYQSKTQLTCICDKHRHWSGHWWLKLEPIIACTSWDCIIKQSCRINQIKGWKSIFKRGLDICVLVFDALMPQCHMFTSQIKLWLYFYVEDYRALTLSPVQFMLTTALKSFIKGNRRFRIIW